MSVYTHIIVFQSLSHVWLFRDPMVFCPWNFPGKNTGMSLPFPSPEDLPNPGIKPVPPTLASRFFTNRCYLGSLILSPYSNFPKLFLSYLFKFNFLELSKKTYMLLFYLFFTWRLIALQNFVGLCQTATWICCSELSLGSLHSITPPFPLFIL